MLISIIVPCYNCEKVIDKCVTSLVNQTYKELEILLVDDGSTDGTWDVINGFNDKRIVPITKINGGTLSARREGVHRANGDYIMFCDSDDYYDDNHVEKVYEQIISKQADIIAFGSTTHFPSGKIVTDKNRLEDGYYNKLDIRNSIMPVLYFNGGFSTAILSTSVCVKAFGKKIIKKAIDVVDDCVRLHEDTLINFVAINTAESIYVANQISGYHVIRNIESKTGRFNPNYKDMLDIYFKERIRLAEIYEYKHMDQILASSYCGYLMYIKKLISRSEIGISKTVTIIKDIAESKEFYECKNNINIKTFGIKEKVFALLINRHFYILAYGLTKVTDVFIKKGI